MSFVQQATQALANGANIIWNLEQLGRPGETVRLDVVDDGIYGSEVPPTPSQPLFIEYRPWPGSTASLLDRLQFAFERTVGISALFQVSGHVGEQLLLQNASGVGVTLRYRVYSFPSPLSRPFISWSFPRRNIGAIGAYRLWSLVNWGAAYMIHDLYASGVAGFNMTVYGFRYGKTFGTSDNESIATAAASPFVSNNIKRGIGASAFEYVIDTNANVQHVWIRGQIADL